MRYRNRLKSFSTFAVVDPTQPNPWTTLVETQAETETVCHCSHHVPGSAVNVVAQVDLLFALVPTENHLHEQHSTIHDLQLLRSRNVHLLVLNNSV